MSHSLKTSIYLFLKDKKVSADSHFNADKGVSLFLEYFHHVQAKQCSVCM